VQQLEDKALVTSKSDVLSHAHNVMLVIRVFVHQELKQLCLLLSKLVVDFGVPINLDRNLFAGLMVQTADDLSERTFAQDFKNLIAVDDMVVKLHFVVALLIVEHGLGSTCKLGLGTLQDVTCIVDHFAGFISLQLLPLILHQVMVVEFQELVTLQGQLASRILLLLLLAVGL